MADPTSILGQYFWSLIDIKLIDIINQNKNLRLWKGEKDSFMKMVVLMILIKIDSTLWDQLGILNREKSIESSLLTVLSYWFIRR